MIKEDNSILMLVSKLFIALHILGSINTVSAGRIPNCFNCGADWQQPIPKGRECPPIATFSNLRFHCVSGNGNSVCYEKYHNGIIFQRGCTDSSPPNNLTNECSTPDSEGIVSCYCDTMHCNYGTQSKTEPTTTTTTELMTTETMNKGSVPHCQMSQWIFFVLPVLVTLMSDGAAFPIDH